MVCPPLLAPHKKNHVLLNMSFFQIHVFLFLVDYPCWCSSVGRAVGRWFESSHQTSRVKPDKLSE